LAALAALLLPGAAQSQTVTYVGTDTVITFTAGGSFTLPPDVTSVQYLVVGGGGGGGGVSNGSSQPAGGGGGAGAYQAATVGGLTGGSTCTVTVGTGGAAGTSAAAAGAGTSSTISGTGCPSVTATGGGTGASSGGGGNNGGASASASGGGGRSSGTGGAGAGTAVGHNGGNASANAGGGGGGATGTGAAGSGNTAGAGGAGTSNSIDGTATTYSTGGDGGGFAGGTGRAAGADGTNPGDGGGGAAGSSGNGSATIGGAGAGGIVIVRYTTTARWARSGGSGTWNNTNNWSAGGCSAPTGMSVPAANAVVTICGITNAASITLDVATASLRSLTIEAGGTLDLSSQTLNLGGSGTPLVINGTFTPSTSTVNYTSAVATTITAANYNNLNGTGGARTLPSSGTVGVAGSFTPGAGAYTITSSTVSFNGSGAQSIAAFTYNNLQTATGGTKTLAGTTTVNSVLTVGASSTIDLGSQTLNLAGTGTPLVVNGTFTPSTSTVVYNFNGAQNIAGTTYNNLQTATGGTKTLAGTATVNSVLTVGGGTTLDLGSQTLNLAGAGTPLVITGTLTVSTSTVIYNNTGGAQNIVALTYNNLQTANSGTKTLAGTTTVSSVLTVGASSTLNLSSQTLNLSGSGTPLVISGTFTPSTSTVVYNFNGAQNIVAATYNNLQTATGGTKTLAGTATVNSVLTVGASTVLDLSSQTLNLAGNGTPFVITGTFTPSTSTVVYNSGGAQNITATTYNNLQTATGGTKTLVGTTTVNSVLTVGASSTIDLSSRTLNLAGNGTPLVITGTFTPSTSTVVYNSGGAQNITATTYNNLQTATGGAKTLAGSTTVNSVLTVGLSSTIDLSSQTLNFAGSGTPLVNNGTFTASTSTVNYTNASPTIITAVNYNNLNGTGGNRTLPGAGTVGIAGNFTSGAGTYTVTGSTVSFNGSGTQTTSAAFTFNNLTINKSGGTMNPGGDVTVNATLTLTSGNISAGSNTVIIPAGGTVSRTSGHVIGNLRKNVAVSGAAIARTFEVGDASAYAPLTVNFSSVSVAGNLTVKATAGPHSDLTNSGLDPTQSPTKQSVNRYWTATNSGVVFSNYSATLNYAAGELDAGLDLTTVGVAKADSCTPPCAWTFPTMVGNATATSATASPMTSFSDFGVGRRVDHFVFTAPGTATPGSPFSVTITAVDKNGSTVTGFTGTATITSTNGNCTISAGGTTLSFTSGVYTGNVTISGTCTDTLKATQVGNSGVTGTSSSVTVGATVASFNVFEASTAANATSGQIYTKISGTGFDLAVVALTSAPAQSTFNGNVTLELLSGTTSGNCPTSSNTPLQTIASFAISGGRTSTSSSAFNVANAYRDVRVRVTCDSTTCPPSGIKACSTDNFSIRPGSFTVTSTNATNTGTSGTPVIKTGASFNLSADSGRTNYDGTPSLDSTKVVGTPGAGTLAGNFSAAVSGVAAGSTFNYSEVGNFGLNTNAVVDTGFTSNDQPNDCNANSTSNSIDGAGKYGCNIGSASVASGTGLGFGRFIPDHFALTAAGSMTQGCNAGGFSYLGQAMQFTGITLEARNSADAKTSNYAGAYAKLDPTSFAAFNFGARDTGGGGTNLSTRVSGSVSGSWTAGALALSVGSLTITRNAIPDGAYAATKIGIAPADPDDSSVTLKASDLNVDVDGNATNDHARIGSGDTGWRFGRLRILPATGVASLPLDVSFRAEYWNGTGFVTNTNDSCTQIARANVKQSAYQAPLAACDTIISTTPVTLSSGAGTLRLSAPSGGHTGSVTLTPQLGSTAGTFCNAVGGGTAATGSAGLSFLQGKWNNSANYDQDPSARAAFGVYGSQPKNYIFFRENY
jgi:hypothetical protein